MKAEWKLWPHDDCPNCGSSLSVLSQALSEDDDERGVGAYDGDDVICDGGCGFKSCISVDEDEGTAWVQDGNIDDLEDNDD